MFRVLNFFGAGGSISWHHRCVTHLYGSNAIQQVMSFELWVMSERC